MIILILLLLPVAVVQAQNNFVPIVDIPFISNDTSISAEQFVTILYGAAISIAAALAVVKIIWGGVQYMFTEVVTSKDKARKDIWGAILGLIIVISAVFILELINPQLSNLSIFRNLPSIGIGDFRPTGSVESVQDRINRGEQSPGDQDVQDDQQNPGFGTTG